jgi:hypothetical protein
MLAVFVGRRLLGADEALGPAIAWAGAAAVALALGLELRAAGRAADAGARAAARWIAWGLGAGLVALGIAALTTAWAAQTFGWEGESRERWQGLAGAAWALPWLAGTVPAVALDLARRHSPRLLPLAQVRQTAAAALAAAFALALPFPANWLATRHEQRWDLTYFKTTAAGTATQNIAAALENPVNVRIFLPPTSELVDELRGYFAGIRGERLSVEILDAAANPRLAKALRVRDNGTVAFTAGDVVLPEPGETPAEDTPAPLTKTIEVGVDFDKAKRTLKKFDAEVQKILLDLGHSDRIVYLTAGHGEATWNAGEPNRKVAAMRQILQAMHFQVKSLSVADGLADAIPEDADLVAILGPTEPFLDAEVAALDAFSQRGGAVLVALDPEGRRTDLPADPLVDWVTRHGATYRPTMLAAEAGIVPVWREKRDRNNLVTNRFSVHPITTFLAERAANVFLFTPGTASFEVSQEGPMKLVVAVRSLGVAWNDLDGDLEFDADGGETKEERHLVVAVTPKEEGPVRRRILATGDASLYSDLALGNIANQQFVYDSFNWLIGSEALSGTTESEEDVKIEHTKEGEAAWFYATVLGVPLLVAGVGIWRTRRRRGGRT